VVLRSLRHLYTLPLKTLVTLMSLSPLNVGHFGVLCSMSLFALLPLKPWSLFVTVVQGTYLFLKEKNTLDVRSLQQRKVSSVSDYLWFGSQKVPTIFGHFFTPAMHCRYGP